jgi:hypothetical protein
LSSFFYYPAAPVLLGKWFPWWRSAWWKRKKLEDYNLWVKHPCCASVIYIYTHTYIHTYIQNTAMHNKIYKSYSVSTDLQKTDSCMWDWDLISSQYTVIVYVITFMTYILREEISVPHTAISFYVWLLIISRSGESWIELLKPDHM